MSLSKDESRALAFVAGLLLLSAGVRVAGSAGSEAAFAELATIPLDSLEEASLAAKADAARRKKPLEPGERLDLNRASEADIDRLPGVGPALASRIVAAREAARFETLADIDAVPGVGAKLMERIAAHSSLPAGAPKDRSKATSRSPAIGETDGTRAPSSVVKKNAVRPRHEEAGTGAEDPIAINAATAAELESLPGIGPALAARIVAFRDSAGTFRGPEDLDRVPGIGPALLSRLTQRVRFAP